MGHRFRTPAYLSGMSTDQALAYLLRGEGPPAGETSPLTQGRHSHEFKAVRNQAQVDLALTLAQEGAAIVRSREKAVAEARERLDELMRLAVREGATTTEVANATRLSRVTVSKAMKFRGRGGEDG